MPLNSYVSEIGTITITSGDRLTIENAADFLHVVRESLKASEAVSIEFDPMVALDITFIMIVCSACKSAALCNKIFSFRGPQPQGLSDLIINCGASRHSSCKHNNNSTCVWFGGTA